jgi:hypothetical protein
MNLTMIIQGDSKLHYNKGLLGRSFEAENVKKAFFRIHHIFRATFLSWCRFQYCVFFDLKKIETIRFIIICQLRSLSVMR